MTGTENTRLRRQYDLPRTWYRWRPYTRIYPLITPADLHTRKEAHRNKREPYKKYTAAFDHWKQMQAHGPNADSETEKGWLERVEHARQAALAAERNAERGHEFPWLDREVGA
jgi:hypothetical protein